jgi:hypothetical protein
MYSQHDFSKQVDRFGNISVDITIGDGPGAEPRETGFSARPSIVARTLRSLADAIDRLPDPSSDSQAKHGV